MAKSKQGSAKESNKTAASRGGEAGRSTAPMRGRGGIAQPVTPSPELGAIVGNEPLSRADLTKRVWDYIKSHDLQDAKDRRQIKADATLKKVLGRDQVDMFELTRLINQHVK